MIADEDKACADCKKTTPHRFQPSPDAGPFWRCSECGIAHNREPELWSADDGERLSDYTLGDAIGHYLDGIEPGCWPNMLTVTGFARMRARVSARWLLDLILENLDEEYGDPECGYSKPTAAMIAAAGVFAAAIESEYDSWACETVTKVTVRVIAWVRENEPQWLDGEEICRQCDAVVVPESRKPPAYATPICYACLPPPNPLPIAGV